MIKYKMAMVYSHRVAVEKYKKSSHIEKVQFKIVHKWYLWHHAYIADISLNPLR